MIHLLPNSFKKVMEPISYPESFNDDDYIYQVKWDGVRILAVIDKKNIYLINKRMHERSKQYPEFNNLPGLIKADSLILDGEVVAIKNGKPSFPTVMRRDGTSNEKTIDYLKQIVPINYMVFDILYLNGRDLRNDTLLDRQSKLRQLVTDDEFIHLVEDFDDGIGLFNAVKASSLEGIVAKRKDSRYQEGKHHKDWLKIKCFRQINCMIGGYTLRGSTVNSLLLGVYEDGKLMYVGKAATGLSSAQQELLSEQLPDEKVNDSPFANLQSGNIAYVNPRLGVMVEYLEWTDDMKLRAPVIKEFINGAPASNFNI